MKCPYEDKRWREEPTIIKSLDEFNLPEEILAALECIGGEEDRMCCDNHPDYWVHRYHFVHPYLVCEQHLEERAKKREDLRISDD